jgi:hypothetical protein
VAEAHTTDQNGCMSCIHQIRSAQREWARHAGIQADASDYCRSVEDNLPWLTADIRADLSGGDGNEIGSETRRGKIAALHSSSALAVNFFGYWKAVGAEPLARTFMVDGSGAQIEFERKFVTPIRSRPNIDVVLRTASGIYAIESKFTEPFQASPKTVIQPA